MSIKARRRQRSRIKFLLETMKPEAPPAFLYHFSPSRNRSSIMGGGLKPSENGFIWLYDNPQQGEKHYNKRHVKGEIDIFKVSTGRWNYYKNLQPHYWATEKAPAITITLLKTIKKAPPK